MPKSLPVPSRHFDFASPPINLILSSSMFELPTLNSLDAIDRQQVHYATIQLNGPRFPIDTADYFNLVIHRALHEGREGAAPPFFRSLDFFPLQPSMRLRISSRLTESLLSSSWSGCCVQAADGIEFEGVKEPCTPSVLRGQRLLQRDEGSKSTLCHKPSWSPYHG